MIERLIEFLLVLAQISGHASIIKPEMDKRRLPEWKNPDDTRTGITFDQTTDDTANRDNRWLAGRALMKRVVNFDIAQQGASITDIEARGFPDDWHVL
ncbi:hypothetical protein [Asaia sp. As-1742]|uniref:hypothetical protein n=1 Tax=Asaia sp. As-1742 TaxID=2608325 RepID=UPI0014210B75|nr:hypothetical protein [Asaia sp. As-1742]NIE79439.1 hypothetical protein [Asaia sp. As-1742]